MRLSPIWPVVAMSFLLISCSREMARERTPDAIAPPTVDAQDSDRRIVQTAGVDLATEDLDAGEKSLRTLVETHRGFVAKSDVGGRTGTRRTGVWTVRVPVAEFRPFLDALVVLGEAISVRTDSLDVTEEYVDLEARLTAKQAEEKRLLTHLRESTRALNEILDVERELSRVRTEVEQLQGQVKALAAKSDLATLVVTLEERVPFQAPIARTLGEKMGAAFGASVGLMKSLAEAGALVAAALAPWLALAAPFGFVGHLLVRRISRRRG